MVRASRAQGQDKRGGWGARRGRFVLFSFEISVILAYTQPSQAGLVEAWR
jgi:hypothetical protein